MVANCIDARLLSVKKKAAGMKVLRLLKTHHLTKMGEAEQLISAVAVGPGGSRVLVAIDVKAAKLPLMLHRFNPIRHQEVLIPKSPVESA